jgi:hypothetical protein
MEKDCTHDDRQRSSAISGKVLRRIDTRLSLKNARACSMSVCVACLLQACSSSSPGNATTLPVPTVSTTSSDQQVTSLVPDSLLQLEDDPGLLSDIPEIVSSEIRADTGLQIAYTRLDQAQMVPGALIESQWLHMQTCLGQVASPPVVMVVEGAVRPFTSSDDVIYDILGNPIASASRRDIAIIQVIESDFDGSLGTPGFNLRSIMGRLLWLSAGLPERDYPYGCAREQPAANGPLN